MGRCIQEVENFYGAVEKRQVEFRQKLVEMYQVFQRLTSLPPGQQISAPLSSMLIFRALGLYNQELGEFAIRSGRGDQVSGI